jgi:glycosyltransferase involved in cell wall biosynthesis
MTPRVSIIVPTRNRMTQLQRALSSVRSQTFRDFEIIVVVDGSTDDTLAWLRPCGEDLRILTTDTAVGAAASRNQGIECARGELIAFLDDDDTWRPSYLEAQIAQLDSHRDAVLSYSDHVNVDPLGHESRPDTQPLLRYENDLMWLLAECFIHTLSIVVCRRKLFDDVGLFNPRLAIVHDLDWYARVLAAGRRFTHLPSALVQRSVPGGLVSSHRIWFREERAVLRRVFDNSPARRAQERRVRAYRALFFAHVGWVKGDLVFSLSRFCEALAQSSHWTARVAALRFRRRIDLRRRADAEGRTATRCDA